MRRTTDKRGNQQGYCLAELMLVLSLLGIFLTLGLAQFSGGLSRQLARSGAQSAQAALAWAQTSVLWGGVTHEVRLADEGVAVSSDSEDPDSTPWISAPGSGVTSNVSQWVTTRGVRVRFVAPFGSPDSGGSLYFGAAAPDYRVAVRPESGLTARSLVP